MTIRTISATGRAMAVALTAALLSGAPGASAAPAVTTIEIDKSAGAKGSGDVEKLTGTGPICLNLKVKLDGKVPDALRRSAEEENPNVITRDLVPCGPAMTGQLTMGPGIEYYVVTEGAAGNRIDLSIYPGSRTQHVSNDVACVFGEDNSTVSFHARGLYHSIVNRYQDVDADGKPTGKAVVSIQLRPVVSSQPDGSDCKP